MIPIIDALKWKKMRTLIYTKFEMEKPFPLRQNAINKRLYDFVPCKLLATEWCNMTVLQSIACFSNLSADLTMSTKIVHICTREFSNGKLNT